MLLSRSFNACKCQKGNSSARASSRLAGSTSQARRCSSAVRLRAAPEAANTLDVEQVADIIAAQPLDDDQKSSLEVLTNTLGVPLGTAKAMVFKKRGLAAMAPDELLDRVRTVADVVGVTTDQAIEMVTIQPGLLFDTQKQAEALKLGIRAICYELNAPKEEIVELILKNQSVLHGRDMHLSVADVAHLAMLRQPTGRIAE
ncbi:hypothetical protein OEZ85_004136 [Tetradesmus obliquus]|uniref:Uncharacterized protein n=2 Tax=Tetradesmus obliquus TaxID=3088 RepID=A0A383VZL7_TETOB|nr:hypothetical protein OEZ85_004136 [Tetradesmus obliquus]|eukprot:jgi/Sobl393_1/13157/SZX69846.1